jgi:hypothetical protein
MTAPYGPWVHFPFSWAPLERADHFLGSFAFSTTVARVLDRMSQCRIVGTVMRQIEKT